MDHDAETGEDTSRRLALCNMDWDRIKAVDILVLCNSFIPKEGIIESVSILPSEFGKERMKEEDFTGRVVVNALRDPMGRVGRFLGTVGPDTGCRDLGMGRSSTGARYRARY